jgi:hypothetical protein
MDKRGSKSIYDESAAYAYYKTLATPALRRTTLRCIATIFRNFFLRQYHAAFLPGRVPVSRVDHPLDMKIPFTPSWVSIYLDFTAFWTRIVTFLLRQYGRRAFESVKEFISSMGSLYAFAAEAYKKNLSTTRRPFYIARPRFFLIHLVDPHLMCIPSLHVMIVIRTYTKFTQIMRALGEYENFVPQIEELKRGAQAISRAILFVKQHSINCISAALYAMTCFGPELFPPEEAEAFAAQVFSQETMPPSPQQHKGLANYTVRPAAAPKMKIPREDAQVILEHVIRLYRQFLSEKENVKTWEEPLLNFMRTAPKV